MWLNQSQGPDHAKQAEWEETFGGLSELEDMIQSALLKRL